MMCMTELHGGVCHRTSTPHKSGNKMKEKKKKKITARIIQLPARYALDGTLHNSIRHTIDQKQHKMTKFHKIHTRSSGGWTCNDLNAFSHNLCSNYNCT